MKSIRSLLITILVLGITGCASTTNQSKFTATTVEQIKAGMTKDEVTTILGEPRSRMADNDGGEIWQYRKNAQEGKAVKIMANITSFGLDTAVDAEYQDILTVTFHTNVVSKATYEENVHNLTPLAGQLRSKRGNLAPNYDGSAAQNLKSLRCQFGNKYDEN